MKIVLDVPVRGRALGDFVRRLLDLTSDLYAAELRNRPLPRLYDTTVRYQHEPTAGSGLEFFDSPWTAHARGWADCDDAVLWRLAELKAGLSHATAATMREVNPETGRFHVALRRMSGRIEDPSLILLKLQEKRHGSR